MSADLMNAACEETKGTMAAVLGCSKEQIDEVDRSDFADAERVWVANYNCPGQTVISGTKEGVQNAS